MNNFIENRNLETELTFRFSRSQGSGGQHVNKVETQVELRFDIPASAQLSDSEKSLLLSALENRLTKEGVLILTNQSTRSQKRNKELVIQQFYDLLRTALQPKKKRRYRPLMPDRQKRLEAKKRRAEKKKFRGKVSYKY